jgi:hypothetical protein
MATKLVWQYNPDRTNWKAGPWRIVVLAGGMFAPDTACGKVFETLRQAQAWCEAQEPESPLPKAGEVWGDNRGADFWRYVRNVVEGDTIEFSWFGADPRKTTPEEWGSWVERGAVRLDGMAGRLAEAEGLLRRMVEGRGISTTVMEQARAWLEGEGRN